jgi:UDP-2-acetamido-3-amino-2,3-dideoxy-glucuronate N-acetyltransferase
MQPPASPSLVPNAQPLRVLLAGAGRWGTNIARSLGEVPGATLSAVSDPDPLAWQAVARTSAPGATPPSFFGEAGAAFALADAVIIAAPDGAHAELALAALNADKHVLVEKPMALTVSDAERLVARAHARRRTLMVGHVLNYHPALEQIEACVQAGRIGQPALLVSERLIERREPGTDAWWALAPHDLSLCRRLLSDVRALSTLHGGDARAESRALLDHAGGAQARLHLALGARARRRRIVLAGSEGTLVFDDEALAPRLELWSALPSSRLAPSDPRQLERVTFASSDALLSAVHRLEAMPVASEPRPLVRELRHFVSAIRRGTTPRTDGREGLAVVRLLAQGASGAASTTASAAAAASALASPSPAPLS